MSRRLHSGTVDQRLAVSEQCKNGAAFRHCLV